jgi:ABC transporter
MASTWGAAITDLVIHAEGLGKAFGNIQALQDLDLAVPTGRVLGLLGPNGAGKTTTVRILTTLVRPDTGQAQVAGHDVTRQPAAVRQAIGLAASPRRSMSTSAAARTSTWSAGCTTWTGPRPIAAPPNCWSGSSCPRQLTGQPAPTQAARRRLDLAVSLVGHPRCCPGRTQQRP